MVLHTRGDDMSVSQDASPQDTSDTDTVMTSTQRRFYASEQCLTARMALQHMVDSQQYNTGSSYFNGNELGFVDRHLYYLSTHPTTPLDGYLSNLKLMTRIRPE
jgi:hypothetical protein